MTTAAPYPADTRAKGWRFELDYEQIDQSDTWALAGAEGQAWLLKMWLIAWREAPCGSMPADEEVLAAKLGMQPKTWAKNRKALMRGWTAGEDGRLYHATITARVLEMLEYRRKNAKRVADFKAKQREQREGNALPPRELQGENDTGTGTGTGTGIEDSGAKAPASSAHAVTPAAAVCLALKSAGIGKVSPGNMRLLTLLEAGAAVAEFVAAVPKAMDAAPGKEFEYVLAMVEGERKRAKETAGLLHRGPLRVVNKQEALEAENRRVGEEWLRQTQGATS